MEIDKKKFKRIQSKVLKKYPHAVTKMDYNGLYYVSDGDTRACEDYLIPSQKTVSEAWYWVAETIKIDQNIQRSHPTRMDIGTLEKKFTRVSNRNKRKK